MPQLKYNQMASFFLSSLLPLFFASIRGSPAIEPDLSNTTEIFRDFPGELLFPSDLSISCSNP